MEISETSRLLEAQLKLVETYSVQAFWQAIDRTYEALPATMEPSPLFQMAAQVSRSTPRSASSAAVASSTTHAPKYEAMLDPQKYLDLDENSSRRSYDLLSSNYCESESGATELKTFRSTSPKPGRLYLN